MSNYSPPHGRGAGVPSQEGLRLILAGVAYLLLICLLQMVVLLSSLSPRPPSLPSNVSDVRDVVALFGWVGFMISGVSVIIVPNHLSVRVRPRCLPTLHLLLANVGLIGFFAVSMAEPGSRLAVAFLGIVSLSFFVFGAGLFRTVLPFLGRRGHLPQLEAPSAPGPHS